MNIKQFKLLLDTLENHYDLTLNTDWSDKSTHSKETLMKSGSCWNLPMDGITKADVVETFLEAQKIYEECIRRKDRRYNYFVLDSMCDLLNPPTGEEE